jgi:hypothetical protein
LIWKTVLRSEITKENGRLDHLDSTVGDLNSGVSDADHGITAPTKRIIHDLTTLFGLANTVRPT